MRTAAAAAVTVFLSVLMLSCASAPEFVSVERPVHFLPDNPQMVGKMNAVSNEVLFSEIIGTFLSGGFFNDGDMTDNLSGNDEGLQKALGRTENVFFAFNNPENGGERIFSLIIQGKFPRGITESMIKKEEGWEKQSSSPRWYKNTISGMEFAVPEKNMIFFSTGKLDEMLRRYTSGSRAQISYEALKEFEVSDIVLYVGNPASGLLKGMPVDTEKFPLSSMWFTLFQSRDMYRLSGVFLLSDEKKAKAMAMLSKILMVGWFRQNKLGTMEELKEQLVIAAAGASVRLSGVYLDSAEVMRLMFSFMPEDGTGLF